MSNQQICFRFPDLMHARMKNSEIREQSALVRVFNTGLIFVFACTDCSI